MPDERGIVLVDMDGTISNPQHRLHFIRKPDDAGDDWKADWELFNTACVDDAPHINIIKLVDALYHAGNRIWILSGRSETVRDDTIRWLNKYKVTWNWLQMREKNDFTEDAKMKEKWLHNMLEIDREKVWLVIDDRDSVVAAWRRNGLTCLQAADGDF